MGFQVDAAPDTLVVRRGAPLTSLLWTVCWVAAGIGVAAYTMEPAFLAMTLAGIVNHLTSSSLVWTFRRPQSSGGPSSAERKSGCVTASVVPLLPRSARATSLHVIQLGDVGRLLPPGESRDIILLPELGGAEASISESKDGRVFARLLLVLRDGRRVCFPGGSVDDVERTQSVVDAINAFVAQPAARSRVANAARRPEAASPRLTVDEGGR